MTDLIAPLRDGLSHADEVHFLKGIRTQGADGHLAGDDHDGRRVQHGIGHARQGVGGAGTAGHQGHAYPTRHAGIALGSMSGALFVAHQDVVKGFLLSARIVVESIIHRHDGAAGVTEDSLHALILQRPHQGFTSSYFLLHIYLVISSRWLSAPS